MAGGLTLESTFEVDGSQDLDELQKDAGEAFEEIEADGKEAQANLSKGFDRLKARGSETWDKLKGAAGKAAIAFGAAAAGVFAAIKAAEAGANVVAGIDTARALGVNAEQLERIQKALDGTVDKLTIAKSIRGALLSGLSADQVAGIAKTASFIAVKLGESKEEMLALAAAGELTDDQLSRIGISTAVIEEDLLKASIAVGRELTDQEQRRVRLLSILKASRKATKDFSADTADAGDASARVVTRFKELKDELLLKILPLVNKFLDTINDWLSRARLAFDTVRKGVQGVLNDKALTQFGTSFRKQFKSLQDDLRSGTKLGAAATESAVHSLGLLLNKVQAVGKLAPAAAFEKIFGSKGQGAKALSMWTRLLELQKAGRLTNESARKVLAATIKTQRGQNSTIKRGNALLKERLEEIKGFQTEARTLVRNFDQSFTDLLSSLGGTFSGVVSALKEIPEKFRILGSLPDLRAGLKATIGLTVQQIEAQREQLGLSDRQVKAAKLFAVALRAGILDQRERVNNEASINVQLRAGLSTLGATAKIAQAQVERYNQIKDVLASTETLELAISALTSKRNDLIGKAVSAEFMGNKTKAESARLELRLTTLQLDRLKGALTRYKEIAAERRGILKLAERIARFELGVEIAGKARENQKAIRDSVRAVATARREIDKITQGVDPRAEISARALQQIRSIQDSLKDLVFEADNLQAQLKGGLFASKDDEFVAKQRLEALTAVIKLRREEIGLVSQRRDAELAALSSTRQFQQLIYAEAFQFSARFGQVMKSSVDSVISGLANTLASLFAGLVSGSENLGQTLLSGLFDTLAAVALQMGTFLILAGTGLTAALVPTGPVAIGAGIALVALAGVLKGLSAVISAPPPSPTVAAAPVSPLSSNTLPGPQERTRESRETVFLLLTESWNGSPEQQARNFSDWYARHGRTTRRRGSLGA